MALTTHRSALALTFAFAISMTACTQPATPVSPTPQASAPEADATPANATVVDDASRTAQPTQACMIAGEFQLLGRTIRSRDCVQPTGAFNEAELKQLCEGLAGTSAQMGGKAGQVTYMAACPAPSQGSCKGLFGRAYDGYYYERSAEDLAGLPASCTQGGGRWSAG